MKLPIKIDDIIHPLSIEDCRIDYKSTFSEATEVPIVSTICAFANDLMNLNGGYIVIGISAPDGEPILPPTGLPANKMERIQQRIRVCCKTMIEPGYQPLITTEIYMGSPLIVIWAPAGDNRPYNSPDMRRPEKRAYHVRIGAETVKATGQIKKQLLEQTARVPFDDRQNLEAGIFSISPILVKRYLQEIGSDLLNEPSCEDIYLYKVLGLVRDVGGVLIPRNFSLLFFNEMPTSFFPCARFEVVEFGDDSGGDLIEERNFQGPLNKVAVEVIRYLDNLTNIKLQKVPNDPRVERTVAFPYQALEEAIVNAAYHRSYENESEPNKVYLYPDRMEIISYPGPVSGIRHSHLVDGRIPPVPARNRRIGEILKELRLAEMRGTGIPKIRRTMQENGSPDPLFDFDDDRSYFRAVLPAHPKYVIIHTLRESAYLWSIGNKDDAISMLKIVFEKQLGSGAIASRLIDYYYNFGYADSAEKVFYMFHGTKTRSEIDMPYITYFKLLLSNGFETEARRVLQMLPENQWHVNPAEIAVSFKRVGLYDIAHTLFSRAYASIEGNPIYLHDYAQTKTEIANKIVKRRRVKTGIDWITINRLRNEAIELLRRAISLLDASHNKTELAWCWFDMARTLQYGRKRTGKSYSESQIEEAYQNAIALLPYERRFGEAHNKWKEYIANKME